MLKQAFLKARGCVFLLLFALFVSPVVSQSASDISSATQVFLQTLSNQELEKTSFAFNDSARLRWNNLPVGLMQRPGIQYGSLSDSSRLAFHRVISMILSSQGYLKVTSIMRLDDILNTLIQVSFDEGRINRQVLTNLQNLDWAYDNYYISLWGTPQENDPWGLAFSGHHISMHLTLAKGSISVSPLFLGSDPAEIPAGKYTGWRVLSKEEDYGFMLLNSLTRNQKNNAVLNHEVPRDIITNPGSDQRITEYYGVSVSTFNDTQKTILGLLIHEYTHNFEHDIAHRLYEQITVTGLDQVYFAWIGSQEKHKPHYYIINGPDFLIEYDNYPNNGNHIHIILREKGSHFGEDLLKEHYLNSLHHKK